jgi:DNA-binding transcriptional LysR family regulator
VHPKKGIYKDGHERPDTVTYRKLYIEALRVLAPFEHTYIGDRLQIPVPPEDTSAAEVVRVYHDECCYASHEGAIQCWVVEGRDGKYRKPRGEIVMASGFICRYVHRFIMFCYVCLLRLLISRFRLLLMVY